MRRITILICVFLLLLGASVKAQTQVQTGKPKLVIDQEVYDAGEMYKSGESLKHDFVVKNTGTADLQILSATPG